MKKVRKGKKILIIILIAIVVIIAATIIIVKVVNKKPEETPTTPVDEQEQVIPLPETTYSGMEVSDIYMEYLKNNNETMITMTVTNTTSKKVDNEMFNTILIGSDENILGQMGYTTINNLEPGEQCSISVVYKGDLTSTKQIKLEKMQ